MEAQQQEKRSEKVEEEVNETMDLISVSSQGLIEQAQIVPIKPEEAQ